MFYNLCVANEDAAVCIKIEINLYNPQIGLVHNEAPGGSVG